MRTSLLFTTLLIGGCGSKQPEFTGIASSSTDRVTTGKIQVVDRLGRTITFDRPPQRIVSISPETTELLFALGVGDRLVGVTEHCDYPSAAKKIDKVGIGTVESISRERIVAVRPDVIFFRWDNQQPLVETFERLNIPIVAMGGESLHQLFEEARWIGKITDTSRNAEAIVAQLETRLAELKQRVPQTEAASRPKVYYEIWDEPLITASTQSFIGELMSLAGLNNIVADALDRYPKINPELVIARDPEIILLPATDKATAKIEAIANRPGWNGVRAVKNHRIYLIGGDEISRCGPRLLDALEQIINAVYAGTD